jgi:diacylglycerol kinase (ATP)
MRGHMAEIKLIANPQAGRGRGRHTIPLVAAILKHEGVPFSLAETEYPGHAIELARRAVADGYETVVALGGDGTIHEVVNGVCADLGDDPNPGAVIKLGVIPAGSGNDFAFALGLPLDLQRVCQLLVRGDTRLVDMGRINNRFFAYGVGMGFDAEVNIESRKIKWLRGMALYLLALLKVLVFSHRSYHVEITFDDVHLEQQAMMVSVANGRRYAGAFLVTPDALLDDGFLNLCIISPVSRLSMLRFLPLVLNGHHTQLSIVKMASARKVLVKSRSPMVSHVDGEVFGLGERRYEFSLLPKRLRVIC